jgi:acid phosphatase type 7
MSGRSHRPSSARRAPAGHAATGTVSTHPRAEHPRNVFVPGAVRLRPKPGHAQAHPGVAPLHPVTHRNTSFQPLPRPLGHAPYRFDLARELPETAEAVDRDGKLVLHVVGDTGGVKDAEFQGNVAEHMLESLSGTDGVPRFCYHVGDVVYFTGARNDYYAQFYEPYAHYDIPILAIPGNHDGEVDDPSAQTSLDGWVDYFMQQHPDVDPISKDSPRVGLSLPNVYWTLLTKHATFVGLYTNVPEGGSVDSVQQQWLTNEFAQADENLPLIFSLHHPIYSFDTYHSGSSKMADVLENAIRDTGRVPNLVLSGHIHNYQRIEQQIVPDGDPTPFIVCGNGGYHNLHKLGATAGHRDPDSGAVLKYAVRTYGYLTLEIDGDTIKGTATEVDKNAKATQGDTFSYSAKPIRLANGKDVPTL